MSHWQKIRNAAQNLRHEICLAENLDPLEIAQTIEFVETAGAYLDLDLIPEHPDSNNLQNALAVLEDTCVYYNNHLKKWYKAFCIAHEIGHFVLHHQSLHCTPQEIDSFVVDGEAGTASERVVGYGAGDRREREANLFALELLLPCELLRELYLEQGLNARKIAERSGMPVEIVSSQLARAVLVPVAEEVNQPLVTEKRELNPSQKRAAETRTCPTLVCAGPGTGKTQTLITRIIHLIEQGVDPKRILALTFSNKAAEEMRERIEKINPQAAAQIQVMTFHAYGLDLLRAYWVEAELDPRTPLVDKIDALLHLEKNLAQLNLEHYQSLHEPTQNLSAILGAISRAKDELCDPEKYLSLGEKMLAEAQAVDNEDQKLKAQKVIETAHVYRFYENYLKAEKLIDFGDLIYRAVKLLQSNDAVKEEVQSKYDAILVDEFQDVNRACGVLLKEIAGDGKSLWTVGDLRQSIYRWRGASPANIELFAVEFPQAETIPLEINYRSRTEIVDLFAGFAGKMISSGEQVFSFWEAKRGAARAENKTAVKLEIADSLLTEAGSIAEQIKRYHAGGRRYKDCAIICRTHAQLSRYAEVLSAQGVPIFYLGELFERSEVRDLLALLDTKVTPQSHSLIRVAAFSEYRIPLSDARKIIQAQKDRKQTCAEVLADAEFFAELSAEGQAGAAGLLGHLSLTSNEVSAWKYLSQYIFEESEFLSAFYASDDVNNQSKRLALYQFLKLAESCAERFAGGENLPIQEFLNHVVKLAHFNEDRNYAQIPAEAENLDAVRLLTVHSAKGLEFPVVFLPYLGAGKIPSKRKSQTCPNPEGMIENEIDFHDAEEECLFFVAMSRARDYLHLSRSTKYGEGTSNESKFLKMIAEALPEAIKIESTDLETDEDAATMTADHMGRGTFYAAELDRYNRCGRDYYYTHILGLKAPGEKSIYLKFHACVYDTLRSMQSMAQLGNITLNEQTALARLAEFWQAAAVDLHAYAPIYKTRAEDIIRRMCAKMLKGVSAHEIIRPTYEVAVAGGTIRVQLDSVELMEGDGTQKIAVVRKYKTGKAPKKSEPDDIDILMRVAAQNNFPEAKSALQKIYLSDDEVKEIPVSAKVISNRLKKYEVTIAKIKQGIFEPAADDSCPYCPHFFICPAGK